MANVIGPDISFYEDEPQTPAGIDFVKMKTITDFVIVRAGQNLWVDKTFAVNWSESKKAGLLRGSYWFFDSRADPKRQAELWVSQMGSDLGELPLFADLEESYNGPFKGWRNWYNFLERLKALVGQKEIAIYTAYYYWRDNAPNATTEPSSLEYFHQYPLWIAHYQTNKPLVPKPWGADEWLFWQFTESGDGPAYGCESKGVDLNYFNGDADALKARFPVNPNPPPTPNPPPLPQPGPGAKYRVTATTLRMRDGPGTNYKIIADVKMNDVVVEVSANADRSWIQVRRSDGRVGWCSAAYLQLVEGAPAPGPDPNPNPNPPPAPTPGAGAKYRVTATTLRMRDGPGTNYNIIAQVKMNDIVVEVSANADRSWIQVKRSDGRVGWCSAAYLQLFEGAPAPSPDPNPNPNPPPTPTPGTGAMYRVNTTSLHMRAGPGTNYNSIGGLKLNDVVEEVGANSDRSWLQIKRSDGLVGWSASRYLTLIQGTPTPPPTPTPDPTPTPTPTPTPPPADTADWYRVTAGSLNARSGPGTNFGVVGSVHSGDTLPALAISDDKGWVQIQRADGFTGWCSLGYMTLIGKGRPEHVQQALFTGTTYLRKVLTAPRKMVTHVMLINLRAGEFQFLVTPPSHKDGTLCSRTTSEFLKEFSLMIAINGNGFSYVDVASNPADACPDNRDCLKLNGPAASRGNFYYQQGQGPTIYINQKNEFSFDKAPGNVFNAISGDRMVVVKGQKVPNLALGAPEPRTALGVSADGRTLILMVVDGRQPDSEGALLPELADLMISYNVYNGVNMDGGGSSALVIKGADGKPVVLNIPADQSGIGNERSLANHLGVFIKS